MFGLLISPVVALLKAYVAQVATKEVAYHILVAVATAVVKSSKTPEDDKWLEVIKGTLGK